METSPPARGGVTSGMRKLMHQHLRDNPTDAEKLLWRQLRMKRIDGVRFRRQYPIGPYIGDFVCLPARLIVEADGGQHATDKGRDERRTA